MPVLERRREHHHHRQLNGGDGDGASTRIINGQDAAQGRFPWFVRLQGADFCGGALIARDLVLTAAHCDTIETAYVGKYDTSNNQEGNPVVSILGFYPNPEWADQIPYNDIMVVQLESPVDMPIIKMNSNPNVPTAYQQLVMLGFGSTTDGVSQPYQPATILQQSPTQYVPFEDCAVANDPESGQAYGTAVDNTGVTGDWFCTFQNSPEQYNHCVGDSGGPIIIEGFDASTDLLVATISGSSPPCGNKYLPDMNQRVSYHYSWILRTGCSISVDPPAEWNCYGMVGSSGGGGGGTTPATSPTTPTSSTTTLPPNPPPTLAPVSSTAAGEPPTNTAPVTTVPTTNAPAPVQFPTTTITTTPTFSPTFNSTEVETTMIPTAAVSSFTTMNTTGMVELHVLIWFDDNPRDISWYLADEKYERFRFGVPLGAYLPGTEYVDQIVYVVGGERYMFVIEDLKGDGLGGTPKGEYQVTLDDGEILVQGGGNFGSMEQQFFNVPDISTSNIGVGVAH